jgi:hypothetical protein
VNLAIHNPNVGDVFLTLPTRGGGSVGAMIADVIDIVGQPVGRWVLGHDGLSAWGISPSLLVKRTKWPEMCANFKKNPNFLDSPLTPCKGIALLIPYRGPSER